ncbi:hypothetical protein Vretimale_15801, partial [Volvox reticuliferus]
MPPLRRDNPLEKQGGCKIIPDWRSGAVCITAMRTCLTYLLLVILQLAALPPSTSGRRILADGVQGVMQGTIASLELHDTSEPPIYYLNHYGSSGPDKIYRLEFCDDVPTSAILLGILVNVPYEKIIDGVVHSCSVPTQPDQESQQNRRRQRLLLGTDISTPLEPRILVYVATFCGYNSPMAATEEEVMKFLMSSANVNNRSLAEYYNTCSYGQVSLRASNVKVLIPPREIPCNGTLSPDQPFATGPNFTTRACDELDNLPKWHYWLDAWAATLGVNAAEYHQRVLILPRDFTTRIPGCNRFAGLGTTGRWQYWSRSAVNDWGTSLIWLTGEYFLNHEVWLHEIGHTYGMAHGNIPGGCDLRDQCDPTCTMGAYGGQGIRCLNAAHNWQIGWGRPFLELSNESLPYGIPTAPIRIPLQLSAKNSSVVVTGAGMPVNQRLFLSVRMNVYPYDLPWKYVEDGNPFVLLHTYNGNDTLFNQPTFRVGEIKLGATWRDTANSSMLSVKFDSWDVDTGAAVRICLRTSDTELNCNDGLDDDCDFLTDNEDPDCLRRSPGMGFISRKTPSMQSTAGGPPQTSSPLPSPRRPKLSKFPGTPPAQLFPSQPSPSEPLSPLPPPSP